MFIIFLPSVISRFVSRLPDQDFSTPLAIETSIQQGRLNLIQSGMNIETATVALNGSFMPGGREVIIGFYQAMMNDFPSAMAGPLPAGIPNGDPTQDEIKQMIVEMAL